MNYAAAVSLISSVTFPKNEWIKRTVLTRNVWVYQLDSGLCIEIDYQDPAFLHLKEFKAPWVAYFPPMIGAQLADGSGARASHYYRVNYGSSLAETENVILVSVDGGPDAIGGGHALLPLPESGTTVSRYRYGLARIVNDSQSNLDWAITTAGFTVAAA
jgi:hypothetical protein